GGFTFNVRRLEAGEPARKATRASSRLSAASGVITSASSSSALSRAAPSAAAEINCTRGAGLAASSNSRISRASNVSPPTTATRGRSPDFANGLANLMLRMAWRRLQTPPYDAADAKEDAAADVACGHRQQYRLRKVPDEIDETAEQHEHQRGARPGQVEILEARVAPRAHHQKRQ